MSYATLKEALVTAKDTDMARLSVPANATPKADRKSNRLRGIFKQRPSSSASPSPAALSKSPPPVGSSPLLPPDLRPGFQRIGLLPGEHSMASLQQFDDEEVGHEDVGIAELGAKGEIATRNDERGSDNLGATRSYGIPALAKMKAEREVKRKGSFAQSAKGTFTKYPVEKADHGVAVSEVVLREDVFPGVVGDADKRSSLPLGSSHKIAEAMSNKNSTSVIDESIEDSENFQTLPHMPVSTLNRGPAEDLNLEHRKSLSTKRTNDLLKITRTPQQLPRSFEAVNGHGNDATALEEDENGSPRKSFASNIFDDDSSLSQGIREYVTSKIAEALVEHDRAHMTSSDTTVRPRLQFTIKIDAAGLTKPKQSTTINSCSAKTDLFTEPSTIGPLRITNVRVARDVQFGLIIIYAVDFLGASLLGPKILLLTVWRLAIILVMYTAVLRYLSWTENVERDVLLAPVYFTGSVATGMGEQLLDQMRLLLVALLAESFERVAHGAGVHVDNE